MASTWAQSPATKCVMVVRAKSGCLVRSAIAKDSSVVADLVNGSWIVCESGGAARAADDTVRVRVAAPVGGWVIGGDGRLKSRRFSRCPC